MSSGGIGISNSQDVTLDVDQINANTDGLETLQSTANGELLAIKTAVEIIDNAIVGNEMQVDVVASLPAGSNNIGDVDIASALPAGDNNIGNVDVVSSVLPAGASTSANQTNRTQMSQITNGTIEADVTANGLQVDVTASVLPTGAATEATVATLATQTTLATRASEATVATLATQTTLATRASEATLATRASEATLATRASEATLATQQAAIKEINDLSFGHNGATVLKTGTTTKTVNFRGIQVLTDLAVVTITGSNVGTDLNAVTLPAGYHPVSGTAIDVTANTGLAYLITEIL